VNLGCVCAWIGCCAGLDFVLFQVEKSRKNWGSNQGTLALVTNNTNGISLRLGVSAFILFVLQSLYLAIWLIYTVGLLKVELDRTWFPLTNRVSLITRDIPLV
jgi:hypothetical protein